MFIENKYTKWYFKIIQKAKSDFRKKLKRKEHDFVYYERHHIIPKALGGTEEVLLTAKEHFICHLLLPKMLEGKQKHMMINALIKMTFAKSQGQERHTARSFSLVRKFIAQKNSETLKGKSKSDAVKMQMKGRCGKWKRTEENKQKSSQIQINRFKNNPGTFLGKHHSKESMQKRTLTRQALGIKPLFTGKGTHWYTNGLVDRMCYENVPIGFYLGRVKNRKKPNESPSQESSAQGTPQDW